MDLSVQNYIGERYQLNNDQVNLSAQIAAADQNYINVNAALANAWSNDKAFDLAEILKQLERGTTKNNQAAALKEFFSLYAVTRSQNGSLGSAAQGFVNAADKNQAAKSLFEGIILKGYIGEPGKNEYTAINDILKRLGVNYKAEVPHSDHFHITFKPPVIQGIKGSTSKALLVASDSINVGAQSEQLAANASTGSTGYTAVLDICKYMAEGKGRVLPLTSLSFYLSSIKQPHPQYLRDAVVTVVRTPNHGALVAKVDMYGETTYDYIATDKSWIGDDRAEFEIEYQGQRYRVITRIKMAVDIDDGRDDKSCDARVRRIAYETTVQTAGNDTDGTGFNADNINALLDAAATRVDLSNVMLVFKDLPDGQAGEASTTGVTAQIILDINAAGHGWFIDPTPLEYSDDYLPTSSPNINLATVHVTVTATPAPTPPTHSPPPAPRAARAG